MKIGFLICAIHVLVFPAMAFAGWEAYIVEAYDGDTLIASRNGLAVIISLYGVDCPEREQAFGLKAEAYTTNLVVGKRAKVVPIEEGRYKKCLVFYDNTCLNTKLLRDGYAWYHEGEPRHAEWSKLEKSAKSFEKGLWSQDNPLPPWEFRAIDQNEPPLDSVHTIKLHRRHKSSGLRPITGRGGVRRPRRTR